MSSSEKNDTTTQDNHQETGDKTETFPCDEPENHSYIEENPTEREAQGEVEESCPCDDDIDVCSDHSEPSEMKERRRLMKAGDNEQRRVADSHCHKSIVSQDFLETIEDSMAEPDLATNSSDPPTQLNDKAGQGNGKYNSLV